MKDDVRAALLYALYHHQGRSSSIGQPIRAMLGIGTYDALSDADIATAKTFPAVRVLVTLEGGQVSGVIANRVGVQVQIVDYDIDGSDEEMHAEIPQDDGTTATAWTCLLESVEARPEFIAAAEAALEGRST